jgi:hypothetical protein
MALVKELSITQWVQRLRDNKYYAILSGSELDDIPGIGTSTVTVHPFVSIVHPSGALSVVMESKF